MVRHYLTSPSTVTLITTVLNERSGIETWLDSLGNQSRLPDEIIIVDGGSTDGTWQVLSSWAAPCAVRLLYEPGASISAGRNIALRHVKSDLVAITDAGTVAEEDWLERLCQPFDDPLVDVSCGLFYPATDGYWMRSLAATTLPEAAEIRAQSFLPSSRSVAIRTAWVRQGFLYPEWLDYCEDIVWDLQLKRAGARFFVARSAFVRFIPRSTWFEYWNQYFRYARGDGKALLFTRRHAIRYLSYLAGIVIVSRRSVPGNAILSIAGCAYIHKPILRLLGRDRRDGEPLLSTLATAPLIVAQRMFGDAAKMCGYPVGIAWRLRKFGFRGLRSGWQSTRFDGSRWSPAAQAAKIPPREV